MKIWFTRPSTWTLVSRGIDGCELWLQKPFYDHTPRGKALDPNLPHLPIGWRVLDHEYGDVSNEVNISVRQAMPEGTHEKVCQALWEAVCHSVDGKGAAEGGLAPQRWVDQLEQNGTWDDGKDAIKSFLFEMEAPPELWFSAALLNGLHHQTAAGVWAQKVFPLDDMFPDEDELPPVAKPVILYERNTVLLLTGGS